MKKTIKTFLFGVLLISIILLALARFTNFRMQIGNKVWLNYDEENKSFVVFGGHKSEYYKLKGIDGPYIIDNKIITVDRNNFIQSEPIDGKVIQVEVNNEDKDVFRLELRDSFQPSKEIYDAPERLIAVSDIEGNFNAFSGFLIKNKVIDEFYNWTFGNGHLVLVGDFVDRGENVIPVLWLIYKLEQDAEKDGGKVHFILGNHEIMNIQGNYKDASHRYKKLAQEIGGNTTNKENYKTLFAQNSHLGAWLRSKNIIEKIGDYIFVHAGLSPEILKHNLTFQDMNILLRDNIDKNLYHNPGENKNANFVMGKLSPFWYRGLVMDYKYYDKIKEPELNSILSHYKATSMVIGHTVVEDVSKDFDGKVIKIDLKHGKSKFSSKTGGLWIENGKTYKVNAKGDKVEL